jgi:hypothetical protein
LDWVTVTHLFSPRGGGSLVLHIVVVLRRELISTFCAVALCVFYSILDTICVIVRVILFCPCSLAWMWCAAF